MGHPVRKDRSLTVAALKEGHPAGKGAVPPQCAVEVVPITKIKPAPYNPRKDLLPGSAEYEKIRRSLEEFGYVGGMVWNKRTGHLVGGHQRFKVLVADMGLTRIQVNVVDLPLEREKALNVQLNNPAGSFDDLALGSLLLELQNCDDVDATLTGFDEREIQLQIDAALAEMVEPVQATQSVEESYAVMVTCRNEADQKRVFREMNKAGRACKVMTL